MDVFVCSLYCKAGIFYTIFGHLYLIDDRFICVLRRNGITALVGVNYRLCANHGGLKFSDTAANARHIAGLIWVRRLLVAFMA